MGARLAPHGQERPATGPVPGSLMTIMVMASRMGNTGYPEEKTSKMAPAAWARCFYRYGAGRIIDDAELKSNWPGPALWENGWMQPKSPDRLPVVVGPRHRMPTLRAQRQAFGCHPGRSAFLHPDDAYRPWRRTVHGRRQPGRAVESQTPVQLFPAEFAQVTNLP